MPLYSCTLCDFHTFKKYDFSRHLKTKKHLKRIENDKTEGAGGLKKTKSSRKEKKRPKMTQNDPKSTQKRPKMTQNDPKKMSQNEPVAKKMSRNNKNTKKKFHCIFCHRGFSTKAHKRRHELHRCKSANNCQYQLRKAEKEKTQLYKQIEMLIEKAGNTTNITNNIQINGFGSEDTSYITDKMLDNLLVYPGTMVPRLVALTHFHKSHPENKNLLITNKKSKYVKVYSNGKWILKNKDDVIDNIMNSNYIVLEDHYSDKAKDTMSNEQIKRIEEFKESIEEEECDTIKNIKDSIELTILNNSGKLQI